MRIAMVTEYAYPVLGGVPEHVHNLSRELVRRGHEVTVLTSLAPLRMKRRARLIDAENLAVHGYRTARMGISMPVVSNGSVARMSVGIGLKPKIARTLRDMDVVHAQGMAPPTLCLFSLRASRAPVNVGTFHTYFEGGHWAYRLFMSYVKSAVRRTDRLIAVSDACVEAVGPYIPRDYDIIPNGVDVDLYRPPAEGEARPEGPPRILFVGRFDPRNGLDTLLEAARILKDEGRDFRVQVVGDGPMRPVYHRQAKSLGVWDRIDWLGLLDKERPRLYREATVFAAPCVLASFGVVLLEAMASGTPVVCADNIGFRQVIRDGAPGRFVPPRDAAGLAAGIAELLDDPAMRAEWGARGREVVVERYSWPRVAHRVEALYEEVLSRKRSGALAPTPPPAGLRHNLRRNPLELVRNFPRALRGEVGEPREWDAQEAHRDRAAGGRDAGG
ncbi:MAG: glycosyltransferase family 4 protein [Thermoleophilia bacterium]